MVLDEAERDPYLCPGGAGTCSIVPWDLRRKRARTFPEVRTTFGFTPLHYAALNLSADTLRALLAAKADVRPAGSEFHRIALWSTRVGYSVTAPLNSLTLLQQFPSYRLHACSSQDPRRLSA